MLFRRLTTTAICSFSICCCFLIFGGQVTAQTSTTTKTKPEFPSLESVTKGYTEVKSADKKTFMRVWKREKDGQMLAELPKDFASPSHRQFIATTISGGVIFAGLQTDDYYVYWKRFGKRVALIQENLNIRGSDEESKASVKRIFTDRVLLELPILTVVPRGGPVIDLDSLLVQNASVFFGGRNRVTRPNLITIKEAKCFAENTEIAVEVPVSGGNLQTLHYSILSLIHI